MKKLLNKPEDIASELIRGLVKSHSDLIKLVDNDLIVRKTPKPAGKVPIVFGQGIGHEPAFDGMVGYGMHDVEIAGNIFACSGGDRIYAGIKYAWELSGQTPVLLIIANHEGDVINANIALELAHEDNIDVKSVLLFDDIASAPKGEEKNRRGMAGIIFGFKAAGAMSENGYDRDEILAKVEKINATTRTLSVAVSPATIPTSGQVLFNLKEDEIIIGPGVHGEAGPEGPMKLTTANEIIEIVAERVIADGEYQPGDEVLVLLNGNGATTLMELFILYNRLEGLLKARGLIPFKPLIGNYVTVQEMAGFSLSLCKADEDTKQFWTAKTETPYFKVFGSQ